MHVVIFWCLDITKAMRIEVHLRNNKFIPLRLRDFTLVFIKGIWSRLNEAYNLSIRTRGDRRELRRNRQGVPSMFCFTSIREGVRRLGSLESFTSIGIVKAGEARHVGAGHCGIRSMRTLHHHHLISQVLRLILTN